MFIYDVYKSIEHGIKNLYNNFPSEDKIGTAIEKAARYIPIISAVIMYVESNALAQQLFSLKMRKVAAITNGNQENREIAVEKREVIKKAIGLRNEAAKSSYRYILTTIPLMILNRNIISDSFAINIAIFQISHFILSNCSKANLDTSCRSFERKEMKRAWQWLSFQLSNHLQATNNPQATNYLQIANNPQTTNNQLLTYQVNTR